MREAVKIRKAEEASGLSEVSVRELRPSPRDFQFAISSRRAYVVRIAGVLRCDPSLGFRRSDLDVTSLAHAAALAGAGAVAIGTDLHLFGGRIDELHAVAGALTVPVLRLDYALDVRQLYTSRLAHADAVLVSAGMLDVPHLLRLQEAARSMGMQVVFESRDEADLARALQVNGAIHGLGDLTGETGLWEPARVLALVQQIPARSTVIALSGVRTAADLNALHGHVDAALITAPWLGAPDPLSAAALFAE